MVLPAALSGLQMKWILRKRKVNTKWAQSDTESIREVEILRDELGKERELRAQQLYLSVHRLHLPVHLDNLSISSSLITSTLLAATINWKPRSLLMKICTNQN